MKSEAITALPLRSVARGASLADGPSIVVCGSVAAGFESVVDELERCFVERGEHGAAFAAVVDGRPVVDLWGGYADWSAHRLWRTDTIAGIFSGTKGLVAVCLSLLIERGLLDLDAPVCAYWPEFSACGKEDILIRHVVSHEAGLPGLATPVSLEEATDAARMAALLAAQPAAWPPGTRVCYHALTFGWLCGELVRRIDGRTVGEMFQDEVASPLALDAWIGLPAELEERLAVLERGPGFGSQPRDRIASSDHDPVGWSIWANPPRFSGDDLPGNRRYWRAAEIPATNGHASARSMARLYGCLARGGEIEGTRLLRPPTIQAGATCLARGVDPYLDKPVRFGIGFQLQTDSMPFGPVPRAYGHNGAGGSAHGAWPELRVGFSYVTTSLRESHERDERPASLLRALHEAVVIDATRSAPTSAAAGAER